MRPERLIGCSGIRTLIICCFVSLLKHRKWTRWAVFRRLIMLIFEDRLAPPSWSRFVGSCLALGSRVGTAQRIRGFSTVGRLDR